MRWQHEDINAIIILWKFLGQVGTPHEKRVADERIGWDSRLGRGWDSPEVGTPCRRLTC